MTTDEETSMTTRMSISLAIAIVGASLLSGTSATPVANADDPLAPIIVAVTTYRSKTECPRLTYNPVLEDAAQKYARSENPQDGQPRNYDGAWAAYLGTGDPQASAIVSAYGGGARDAITNCGYRELGVGFIRHDDRSVDVVTLVFGTPTSRVESPKTPDPASTAQPVPPVQCPMGSPTPNVPAGQTCAPVPPPKDQVRVSFDKGFQRTVNVTSTADIAGKCTYAATNPVLPGSNKSFDIGPRGSASFTVLAPPPFSTYHVVVSCSGTFNGNNVEFGHVEEDVSA
jgi:hypothetical protein